MSGWEWLVRGVVSVVAAVVFLRVTAHHLAQMQRQLTLRERRLRVRARLVSESPNHPAGKAA